MKYFKLSGLLIVFLSLLIFLGCQTHELTYAKVYLQQRDYANAEYNLLTALDIEPENPEIPYLLAVTIYANRNSGKADIIKAKHYMDMTLKIDPKYEKENIKILREQLYTNAFNTAVGYAVEYYNSVIRNESQNPQDDLASALEYFQLASDLRPSDPRAAAQIARLHSELGKDYDEPIAPEDMKSTEKIFDVPGVSKDELFVRANSWFVDTFKSAESVIQYQDKGAGRIMGKYVYDELLNVIVIRIKQTISIDIKDERVRIQISNPFFSTKSALESSAIFSNERELKSRVGLEMANEEWKKLINNLATYLQKDTSW